MNINKIIACGYLAIFGSLAGCSAQGDVLYCRNLGVEGTAEQGNCMAYYHQQEAVFATDRDVCMVEADKIYPPSLYDFGGYAYTSMGTGWGGHHGGFYGGHTIHIDPDFRRNAELDRLRMNIIEPCMQSRGWVSGRTWQAGRQPPLKPRSKPAKIESEALPWLR